MKESAVKSELQMAQEKKNQIKANVEQQIALKIEEEEFQALPRAQRKAVEA